jgi:hypothetical protein
MPPGRSSGHSSTRYFSRQIHTEGTDGPAVLHPFKNTAALTWKNRANASTCLTLSFRLPVKISEIVESGSGSDIALRRVAGLDQIAQHFDAGDRRDRVVFLGVFFDEYSKSQQIFCLVGGSAAPTIAWTVERRDRTLIFFFGMDIPQRAF